MYSNSNPSRQLNDSERQRAELEQLVARLSVVRDMHTCTYMHMHTSINTALTSGPQQLSRRDRHPTSPPAPAPSRHHEVWHARLRNTCNVQGGWVSAVRGLAEQLQDLQRAVLAIERRPSPTSQSIPSHDNAPSPQVRTWGHPPLMRADACTGAQPTGLPGPAGVMPMRQHIASSTAATVRL